MTDNISKGTMTVAETAAILGVTQDAVKNRIVQGQYGDFADYVQEGSRKHYLIYRERFFKWLKGDDMIATRGIDALTQAINDLYVKIGLF